MKTGSMELLFFFKKDRNGIFLHINEILNRIRHNDSMVGLMFSHRKKKKEWGEDPTHLHDAFVENRRGRKKELNGTS